MASFAERQRRYLWTDAFAVCNFLGAGQQDRATALIDRVHQDLGRHRSDDERSGWISGLSEADGAAHPTIGGLRIGKPLPERRIGEPPDERTEWDRDGQYFHYLTKWMHALHQAARATGRDDFATWARELAETAHRLFIYAPHRMYWKMSIDLSRPQVASMGHHDPLDGYVTCLQVGAASEIVDDFRAMIDPPGLATGDPLGIGGLLFDASRLVQFDRDPAMREAITTAARVGLEHYARAGDMELSATRRLAFRELGLAIGLAAVELVRLPGFGGFMKLRDSIIEFWNTPAHREATLYREHQDINDVMLATSLAPNGFVVTQLLGR